MSEYKAHTRALETEVEELAKRPVLDHGSGLQALREELANEKHAVKEARRGTSRCLQYRKTNTFPDLLFILALDEKDKATQKDGETIEELELRGEIGAGRQVLPGLRLLSPSANPA